MKGQILDYSIQQNAGVITTESGERYKFEGAEWHADVQPTRGISVDFDIQDGKAVGIYRSLGSSAGRSSSGASRSSGNTDAKSKTTAAILALLLGAYGGHKFYIGAWGWGITYLATTIFSIIACSALDEAGSDIAGLFFLFILVPGITAFVEFIRYLTLSNDDWNTKLTEKPVEPFTFVW